MRLRRQPLSFSILLLHLIVVSCANTLEHVANIAEGNAGKNDLQLGPNPATGGNSVINSVPVVGTKDAPVDGKDGRPHQGPFVETSAERDRKKAKEISEDDLSTTGRKPLPKESVPDTAYLEGWDKMPVSNDGVMDDPGRLGPKEGTRGTEGGITEKNREKKEKERLDGLGDSRPEKTPEAPKELPPLPNSEEISQPIKELDSTNSDGGASRVEESRTPSKGALDAEELGGLKKPDDLPEKPHDIPHPVPVGASKDRLVVSKPTGSLKEIPTSASLIQPLHSFLLSFTMIIFSEIGDKTFLIAALMAMKHPPLFVFSAAFPALLVMTVLSAVLGHAVPALISERFTSFAAAVLFLVFGAKMLREGLAISPKEGVDEEMKEVELELEEKEQKARKFGRRRSSLTPYMLESGRNSRKPRSNSRLPAPPDSPPSSPGSRSPSPNRSSTLANVLNGMNNLFSLLLSPAWVQTFVMTFLGEWGDRSQIATIAMSAGQDYWWVTGGALIGHSICTLLACFGGRAIAGRVSLRIVTLGGAIAFLCFGFIYLAESFYYR